METSAITTTTDKIETPVFQNVLDAIVYYNLNNVETQKITSQQNLDIAISLF